MFYARVEELKTLKARLADKGQAVLIYGKRRVGKTFLIKEALPKRSIYFECTADTLETNLAAFRNQCVLSGIAVPDYVQFSSFVAAFQYLDSLGEPISVAIDEYPFLRELNEPSRVDSIFQNVIDNHLNHLNLIIAGSAVKVMQSLLVEGNPLYGRFKQTIHLPEMNYIEVSAFYSNKSVFEKIAFYSVFGGSPYVNRSVDPALGINENIIQTLLKEGSEVFNYAESIAITDVANQLQAKRILSVLSNGRKRHMDLIHELDKNKTGVIARALQSLQDLGVIRKVAPINWVDDAKKTRYEIADNVLRFFYTFVYPNKSRLALLGPEAFFEEYVLPKLAPFVSLRFEEQARDYFSLLVKAGRLKGVKNIGTYYYDDIQRHSNGEFDVALETSKGFDIYEVKYLRHPLNGAAMMHEIKQIQAIQEIKVHKVGFISAIGFDYPLEGYDLIDGEMMYSL